MKESENVVFEDIAVVLSHLKADNLKLSAILDQGASVHSVASFLRFVHACAELNFMHRHLQVLSKLLPRDQSLLLNATLGLEMQKRAQMREDFMNVELPRDDEA